ncbi:MAG: PA14 domain-containing protein [Limisphaerales bacterium]
MQKLTKMICLVALAGAAATAVQAAPAAPQGFISGRAFTDIGGVNVADLLASPKFPDSPDAAQYPEYFEWNPDPSGDITLGASNWADNYGGQLVGYFYPPTTGQYTFWLAADDGAALYLSTDDTAANKKLIATETGWSGIRSFTAVGGGSTVEEKSSATFAGSEWPTPNVINLTAGQAYYIEALWKEGGGGDNCAVAVEDPTGLIDPTLPIPGEYLATIDKTMGAANITTQPVSQTIEEGRGVTFSVVANGTPPYAYQWRKGGVDIAGANGMKYSIAAVSAADNGAAFSVVVTGGQGTVTSADAILTVDSDVDAPTLVQANGFKDPNHVKIMFSEPLDTASATTVGNYSISGGVTVTGAAMAGADAVILTTSTQADGTVYTITVNNVKDAAAIANTIAANSTIVFNSVQFISGLVSWERWNGGDSIDNFVTAYNDDTLGAPDVTWATGLFESGRNLADQYRGHGYAWITPATTGAYRFIVTVDDNARVFLSTDDDPANKLLIAAEANWSNNREWAAASEEQDTETWATDVGGAYGLPQWPTFEISLTAGQKYYLEVLWQEGGGGDGAELTWTAFGDPRPANGTASALTGDLVGTYADPTTLTPIIKTPAGNSGQIVDGGTSFTLEVTHQGGVDFQWTKNGVAIAGATSSSLTIAEADATDSGQYRCTVSNPNGSAQSPLMNVMVTATGVFAIEAEDFDYDGGQTIPAASTMPYLGDAYNGLGAFHGVDYNSGNGTDSPVYRGGEVLVGGTAAPMAAEGAGAQFSMERMGEWTMTTNYKIGWIDGGDWGNYTRTFPEGNYWVLAASSYDGTAANQLNGSLGLVTAGVGTATQTVEKLGNFTAPGTAGWSRNNLVALTDDGGSIATVSLAGENTIRWNYNSGDVDYLVFVPASVSEVVEITGIVRSGNSVTVTWTGGGEAEVSDNLNGPWQATGNTSGTFTATIDPATSAAYLRIRK